jgi:hypothetical protein
MKIAKRQKRPCLRATLAILPLLVMGCFPGEIEIEDVGKVGLGVVDPTLFDAMQSVVLVVVKTDLAEADCVTLVDLNPEEIDGGENSSNDLRGMEVTVVTKLSDDGQARSYQFGKVRPGPTAFLALGTREPVDEVERAVILARDKTIAVGCEEVNVERGKRHRLDMVLFPAGLR